MGFAFLAVGLITLGITFAWWVKIEMPGSSWAEVERFAEWLYCFLLPLGVTTTAIGLAWVGASLK